MNIISDNQGDDLNDAFKDDNEQEIEEFLSKVYEDNIENISLYAKIIQISQITSILSIVTFLILLAIRLGSFTTFSYLYLLIPGLISIIALIIMTNIFLLIKDLIDSPERARDSTIQTGTVISYLCVNAIGINCIILIVLIFLKIQLIITAYWVTIFIPLYVGCCIAIFFVVFLTPAFVQNHLYFEIAILFIDVICVFAFGILFSVKADNNFHYSFGITIIPVYFALGLNAMNLLLQSFINKANHTTTILLILSLVSFFISVILVHLKQDNVIQNNNNWVEVIIGMIGFSLLFAESVYSAFFDQDDDSEAQ